MPSRSRPPPRLDSWPVKSEAAKVDALLPMARRIAHSIGRRCPPRLRTEIFAAAAIGAWETVRKHPELDRAEAQRVATVRIRGAIIDELRAMDWLPRNVRRAISRGEIAPIQMVYLDHLGDRMEADPLDSLRTSSTQDEVEAADDARAAGRRLYAAMAGLDERDRSLLADYYLRDKPLGVIATEFGISSPRASQIRKRAVERLRVALVTPMPRDDG